MTTSTAVSDDTESAGRTGWRTATPWVMIATYVLAPLLIIPAAGEQSAPTAVIALVFGAAAVFGFVDGWTFRFTWSLPILAGVGFWLAKTLYLNDGTFIYLLGCVVIAALAGALGSAANRGKGARA
ncbi:hypothetical protein V6D40_00710 [Corynebacterium sp. Q4381]|uniref:hypothetical protein n=1 Tax=Corynebacterium sp. Marseille-Q4381 TaxID=3121597 RepID=UPI002FE62CBC